MIHLQYHPHTVYVFRTNISQSVPNRQHCLERYLALDRQLAFVADYLGCASSIGVGTLFKLGGGAKLLIQGLSFFHTGAV